MRGDVRALLRPDEGTTLIPLLAPATVDPREDHQANTADEEQRGREGGRRLGRAGAAHQDAHEPEQDEADPDDDAPAARLSGRAGRLPGGTRGGRGPLGSLVVVRLLPHQGSADEGDDDRYDRAADDVDAQGGEQQRAADDKCGQGQQPRDVGATFLRGIPRIIITLGRRERQDGPEGGIEHEPDAARQR